MPHQCLQCGKLFGDGSTELLKGCTGCGGTRFFFTREALDDGKRAEIAHKAKEDVRGLLEEVLRSGDRPEWGKGLWSKQAWETWVRAESPAPAAAAPDAPPAKVWEVRAEEAEAPPKKTVQATLQAGPADAAPAAPAPFAPDPAPERLAPVRPETLRITQPGTYELDIERLVERAPIIVEKDGVYMVHLPSVFDTLPKKPRRSGP